MTIDEVLIQRLLTQRLAGEPFATPEAMVEWLGAVQSQDFGNAKWSVGQRTVNCLDSEVQASFDQGKILRTHLLRPTWHFVTPADIHWMLQLTAPHVKRLNGTMYRKLEMDHVERARSREVLARELEGGKHLKRTDLETVLQKAGFVTDKLRFVYFMMDAELEGLICSGAMCGKQQTYALLDERAPQKTILTDEEALSELTRRFFTGHGPASARDYVRWSGLTVADANKGLELVKRDLMRVSVDDTILWFGESRSVPPTSSCRAYLLPEYDECVLSYPHINFPDKHWTRDRNDWNDFFYRPVIIDRKRAGTWRRTVKRNTVALETYLFATLNAKEQRVLEAEAKRYSTYMEVPVSLKFI